MTTTNSILVISPYKYNGTWVFDDETVGLIREPFVAGIPEIIDYITDYRTNNKFNLTFSTYACPGHTNSLLWLRAEAGGNWYQLCEQPSLEGWLCPALFKYFEEAPKKIYVRWDEL